MIFDCSFISLHSLYGFPHSIILKQKLLEWPHDGGGDEPGDRQSDHPWGGNAGEDFPVDALTRFHGADGNHTADLEEEFKWNCSKNRKPKNSVPYQAMRSGDGQSQFGGQQHSNRRPKLDGETAELTNNENFKNSIP